MEIENQTAEGQEETAESIIDSLVVETAPDNPPTPEVDTEEFTKNFSSYFGENVSIDDVKGINSLKDNYAQLQKERNDLQAQSQIPAFSNEFVKEINDLVSAGATQEEVSNYISLGALDLDKMEASDVHRQKIKIENPSLSAAEINALVEEKLTLPTDDDGKVSIADQARLNIDTSKAKAFLREKKLSFKETEAVRSNRASQQESQKLMNGWSNVNSAIFDNNFQEVTKTVELGEGIDPFVGKHTVSPELKAEVVSAATQVLADRGVALTKENVGEATELINMMIWAKNGQQMYQEGIMSALNKQKVDTTKNLSGLPSTRNGSVLPNATKDQSWKDQIKAEDGFLS